ncbi:inositol monophosphatase 2-like [Culicoides brevitarsis]|uniref:inositol monophosphatase 2-like n=1 Tax=Culicoides brevitarsis TaxID=469753 RepID=UPI00307C04BB
MDAKTLDECFDYVYKLTLECGKIVKEAASKAKNITTKEHRCDFVTEYDKKVEDILMKGILEKYPHHKVVAEESAYGKSLPELTDDPTWIIDPIDGTQNFTRNIKIICISIGLAVNKQLVASICMNPCMDEMYTAKKGQGAFLNGERIHVSNCKDFRDAVFSFTLIPVRQKNVNYMPRIMEFMRQSMGIRILGSIAMATCYIASGLMDAYNFENAAPWDAAGAVLLVEEAGGVVKSSSGGPYDIMKPNMVVAATEELCDQMIQMIKKVEEKEKV